MNFESELKKGNFVIPECHHCRKITWPPSEFCNQCLDKNSWRICSNQGKIIEFSKQNETYFCIAEFEKSIRIMGKILLGKPESGKKIEVVQCGIDNDTYFLNMRVFE